MKFHIDSLVFMLKNKQFPIPPLYFVVVYLLGMLLNFHSFFIAAIITLSFAVTYKFIITKKILLNNLGSIIKLPNTKYFIPNKIKIYQLAIGIIFLSPLAYSSYFYFGKIGLNIWHNSTTIFLMPFALLLFFQSYKYLINTTNKFPWAILLLAIINILIKPSYYFVFAVCFPLFTLIKFGFKKNTVYSIIVVALCTGLLLFEYYLIYINNLNYGYSNQTRSSIAISPFIVWHHYSKNILLDFLFSIMFPILNGIFYFKDIKKNALVIYASANFIISMCIFILLTETGARIFDGNFIWQAVVCNYFLFLSCIIFFIKKLSVTKKWYWKNIILASVLFVNFITGVIYIFKYLYTGYYF